ncbi:hypothetical protein PMIN04_005311 [Paraphaeosphaeria minitans]|uniref:Uncharacterized protein n=1 Tax=Paraphaeosphaeria minitans TaxID=565426 RepID=A0A9P6GL80_9PLEO|nr:hypothetical protein PMIN01_06316 [Paraphaeosphaeria minitans]
MVDPEQLTDSIAATSSSTTPCELPAKVTTSVLTNQVYGLPEVDGVVDEMLDAPETDIVVNEPTEDTVEVLGAVKTTEEGVAVVEDVTLKLVARLEEPLSKVLRVELLDEASPVLPADVHLVRVELRTLEYALPELLATEDEALPAQVPKADWQPALQ